MNPENPTGQEEQKSSIEKIDAQNDELLSFNEGKLKSLIEDIGNLLKIDDYEKKEISRKLGDDAPDFLIEIETTDNEFRGLMLNYNSEINNISVEKQEEKMKLFFQKLSAFKETNYNLLEKIDNNDGNFINTLIDKTKFNKNEHEGFWNTPEAIGDGLANGMLTKIKNYENLFEGGMDGIMTLISSLTENPMGLLKSIWEEVKKDFANLIDFEGPTYKIAQTIGKFIVDIILQLILGGAGIVGKLATTINKLIPEGVIKKGINKSVNFTSKVGTESIGINKDLLSIKGIKELGIKGVGKKLGNELMYYSGSTPYIVMKEGDKLLKSSTDFVKWAKETNKVLAKEGYKIPVNKMMTSFSPNGEYLVQMVKLEKKLTPKTKIGQEALRYLNLVEKGLQVMNKNKFEKIAKLTGKTELWIKRLSIYQQNQNNENLDNFGKSELFKTFYSDLSKKFQKKEENYIA